MHSEAPNSREEHDSDFDEITEVRTKVSKLNIAGYPIKPERNQSLDQYSTKGLGHKLQVQLDQWSHNKILKARVFLAENDERQAITEATLKEWKAKGNIHDYESGVDEDGQLSYTVFYRYI